MIDGHIHINGQGFTMEMLNKMVEVAKEKKIDTLYILDHTHVFKEFDFLYSKITEEKTLSWYKKKNQISIKEYLDFINEAKSRTWDIDLKFGLEVCYFKETEDMLRDELKKYNFDFLIGSVHFALGAAFDIDETILDKFDFDEMFLDYMDSLKACVRSKLFTFLGHPDSIKVYGRKTTFDILPYYEELAKLLKEYNQETENNSGLVRYGFSYPGLDPNILEIFKKYDVKFHKSSDAHNYLDIGRVFDLMEDNL